MSATVTVYGKPACPCLAKWLPVYERELRETGNLVGAFKVYQLNGDADASAGTHTGGAYDVTDGTPDQGDVWIGRQMGAAEWLRTVAQGFIVHRHGILRNCPHNIGGRYQIGLLDRGYNGLKGDAPDDGPRNFEVRTWQEGIAWARKRQRRRALDRRIVAVRKKRDWARKRLAKLRGRREAL